MDKSTIDFITKRGVSKIIYEGEFVRLLNGGSPLRLKMGFDPSRSDIHLGHVVGLRKLRQLQNIGHQVILIVGDWTAQIGDPSGQSVMRPMLTREEVVENAGTYMKQFFRIVDKERTKVVWQSEWFGEFDLAKVIELTSRFTVAQFLAREDFSSRYNSGKPIAITELLYPLLQAYDSVAIEADVEFGGTDQEFNLLVGRDLQNMMGQRQQQCFLMPLLVGLDGHQKMSKSLNNYIGVDDKPNDMYGKVMSLPDSLIYDYFNLLTDVNDNELDQIHKDLGSDDSNPMDLKKRLAYDITSQFWEATKAQDAGRYFEQVIQQGSLPDAIQDIEVGFAAVDTPVNLSEVLISAGFLNSKSEAKRLFSQGAIEIDGIKITDHRATVKAGDIVKVGSRRWGRIVAAKDSKS